MLMIQILLVVYLFNRNQTEYYTERADHRHYPGNATQWTAEFDRYKHTDQFLLYEQQLFIKRF